MVGNVSFVSIWMKYPIYCPPNEQSRAKQARFSAFRPRQLPSVRPAPSPTARGGRSPIARECPPLPANGQRSENGMDSPLPRFVRTAVIPRLATQTSHCRRDGAPITMTFVWRLTAPLR